MGSFRYRKSFKIAPGVKLNLNTKSTSITLGGKGIKKTYSSTGRSTTSVRIPGTGLTYVETEGSNKKKVPNPLKKQRTGVSRNRMPNPIKTPEKPRNSAEESRRNNMSEKIDWQQDQQKDFERMARENYYKMNGGGNGRKMPDRGNREKDSFGRKILNGILWVVSAFFLFSALIYIPSISSLLFAIIGLICNPFVRRRLARIGKKPGRGLSFFMAFILFFAGAAAMSDSSDSNKTWDDAYYDDELEPLENEVISIVPTDMPESMMPTESQTETQTEVQTEPVPAYLYVPAKDIRALCGDEGLELTWSPVDGATSYLIYKEIGQKWYKCLETEEFRYLDDQVESGEDYSYTVAALYEEQAEPAELNANAITASYVGPLKAKSLKLRNGQDGVNISWEAVRGADGYNIYRKVGDGDYERIEMIMTPDTTTYVDKAAMENQPYNYYIAPARNLEEDMVEGSGASKDMLRIAGTDLSDIEGASLGFSASWTEADDVDGYELQYSTDETFKTSAKVNDVGNLSGKKVRDLPEGDYFVRIRSYKTVGGTTYYSAWSKTKKFKSLPEPVKETSKATVKGTTKQAAIKQTTTKQKVESVKETYILNKNTKKFHYPYCRDIKKMKASNKKVMKESREYMVSHYSPCGHCNP